MNRNGLGKAQRMQLKAFICLLGALFLLILLIAKLVVSLLHREEKELESSEVHIPVVEELFNVWILETDEEGILIFRDGEREEYAWGTAASADGSGEVAYQPTEPVREQVADIVLTDGLVTELSVKTEKINGKVLRADEDSIELEGYGEIPLAENYRGYRLYDSLQMCTARNLKFGYNFADFCLENGRICAILQVKEEAMEYIRVLVKASDYAGNLHAAPIVTADTDFTVVYGNPDELRMENFAAGVEVEFRYDSSYFESDRVRIIPDVLTGKTTITNLNRSQGTPSYRGQLELFRTEEGIAVINEVPLEDYLYSVVPSEMPAGYPAEALKAQAVCARTYAYGHMLQAGYPKYGAHVDDSTSYQVYNNIVEQESTTNAVKETYGQLLVSEDGQLAGTYYYSTSCGVGSDANVWKTDSAKAITYLHAKELSHEAMEEELAARTADEGAASEKVEDDSLGEALREEENFASFIGGKNPDAFEATEGWYRWIYEVEELDVAHLREVLQKRYAANSKLVLTLKDGEYVSREIGEFEKITDIYIEKRGAGGVADELMIETDGGGYKVISEHNIRYVLNNGESKVHRQDGSRVDSPSILPSGFFVLTTGKEDGCVVGYTLNGGGFGHGVGMSQNGARHMAKSGYTAEEILLYFYENCALKNIYE